MNYLVIGIFNHLWDNQKMRYHAASKIASFEGYSMASECICDLFLYKAANEGKLKCEAT